MNHSTLLNHLAYGERRDVEIKGPGSINDPAFLAHVAKAALALSNHRDGGVVIIGATLETDGRYQISPLTDAQLAGWRNKDIILDKLGPFGAPQIICELDDVPNGLSCAILRVRQFIETPVICTKTIPSGCEPRLRRGVLYCRPSGGKPRSVQPEDPEQLRDVLVLAIQVGINRFVEQAYRSGALNPTGLITRQPDLDLFTSQRGEDL